MSGPEPGGIEPGRLVASRYEVLSVIGTGATGTVYLARDRASEPEGERVALKVVHRQLCNHPQIVGRYRREAKILRRLEGPHVVKLLELVEDEGLLAIVLEYVAGPSLERYLERRRQLGVDRAVAIFWQICEALDEAHRAGVIHRDLKPDNVLLAGAVPEPEDEPAEAPVPVVRVVDFGLAKVIHGDLTGTQLTQLTARDMVFGTPAYMSPEQIRGEPLDARCDLYAAGVMLYEMLAGELPFVGSGPIATMMAHLDQEVPLVRRAAPERSIPEELEHAVAKALAKRPEERFASALELGRAVRAACPAAAPGPEGGASTTLRSLDAEGDAPAPRSRGASVRVVVAAVGPDSKEQRSARDAGRRRLEQRLWTIAAVVAALAAVALGILFGVR
ncbi:MAG: serine/threonine protein kinase [Deltaproteobacteria bacterium]|nr:serine/threonine protein kinase [Deltaproteobacteria bacterium]